MGKFLYVLLCVDESHIPSVPTQTFLDEIFYVKDTKSAFPNSGMFLSSKQSGLVTGKHQANPPELRLFLFFIQSKQFSLER